MRKVLHALLHLYPAGFRARFGDDMARHLDDTLRDLERRTFAGRSILILVTAAELVYGAVAEHLNPTWRVHTIAPRKDALMQALLFGWVRDLRYAARSLMRAPGFTAVTVITLGLAIGVNAGMFSVVRTVLLDDLPYSNPDRLMYIAATAPGTGMPDEFGVSREFYVHYGERSQLIEELSTMLSYTNTLRLGDRVERVRMSWPTSTLFSTLGVTPMLGRTPVAEDEDRAVMLSHELWATWFGSDSTVIGRSVEISGAPRTIVGVMGPGFDFPREGTMLWLSSVIRPDGIRPGEFLAPLVARVKRGVTPEQLARELTLLSKELPDRFGGDASYARTIEQHSAVVRPLSAQLLGDVSRPLMVLLGAVGVVLLIACANVANLFAVRAEWRQRDLAVRRAIGAGRTQLIQTQLAESIIIAGAAAVFAVGLAATTLPLFVSAAPAEIPRIGGVRMDGGTLLFTAGAALVAGLLCGLFPALRASSPSLTWLRDGARGSTRRSSWSRDGLVVAQTALALVLLIGSSLLVRSARALASVDTGYDTEDILTFQVAPEGPHLPDGPAYAQFAMQLMERLAALPGVQSVGLVENVPLNEGTALARFRSETMGTAEDAGVLLDYTFAAGDYFNTMGIAVLAGRGFERTDHDTAARNVVVSRGAAAALWPGSDAVGRRIIDDRVGEWYTVVGVVEDVLQNDVRDMPQPTIYLPLVGPTAMSWAITSPAYVMRTPRAETIAPEVRAIVREMAPEAPMYRVYTMAGLARDSMIRLTFTMLTMGILTTLAIVLGTVGLYGVLSYVVAQRTREIGVRMALGAERGRVRGMVVVQGGRLVLAGVTVGIVAALASTRALESLLFGVGRLDAFTFVVMSAGMMAIGFVASWVPAVRASRVDPIESLKE